MMNYIVLYGGNALIHSFPASFDENKDSTIDVGANAVYQTEWLRNLTDKSQNEHRDLLCHHRSGGHLVLDEENNTWF